MSVGLDPSLGHVTDVAVTSAEASSSRAYIAVSFASGFVCVYGLESAYVKPCAEEKHLTLEIIDSIL